MRSSSTDRRATRRAGAGPRPAGAGAWLRLALVGVLGVAALVAPSAVGRTGAIYTDTATVGFTVLPSSAPTPTPSLTAAAPAAAMPALVAAPAGAAAPAPSDTPTETPSDAPTAGPTPQPSATATPLQAPMLPATGRWHPRGGR